MTTELDLGWIDTRLGGLRRQEPGQGSGLCRAVAARLSVDVVLVRVVVALLALSGGLGIALYLWGTALTQGPTGVRPIDSILPSFVNWGRRAQQATVILSSVGLVAAVSSITPLPWFPGVLVIALLLLARRRQGLVGRNQAWPPPATRPQPAGPESDDALVARWRATMNAAAGPAKLPVVDLYSPEPERRPDAPKARTAWLAGTALLLVSAGAGVGAYLVFGDPVLGLGAGLILAGLLTVVHAVATRTRRVPRPVLVLMVAGAALAGWLSTQAATPDIPSGTYTVEAVAQERVVDLTAEDLTDVDEIRIEAVLSDLTVILPGPPDDVDTSDVHVSDLTIAPGDGDAFEIPIIVDSTLSSVTLES